MKSRARAFANPAAIYCAVLLFFTLLAPPLFRT